MGVMQRLRRFDDRVGQRFGGLRKSTESRRDYLDRLGRTSFTGYVPREVYAELIELHDRVARLEATVARLENRP